MLGWAHAGATRNALTKGMIESFKVPKPPIPVQCRIADMLGKLDDRIELNRQMNRTLEKMAAAIFKSWFIDFDPVRAKADGCDTGLPAEIADLFPDSFEDSDLGPIPKGWKSGSLGDVADSPRRGVNPSDVPPTTPYIGLEHMPRRCIALDAWGRAEDVASGKSQFKQGEILFGKLRPYFHKVGIAPIDGVCSTDIVVVTPKTRDWHGYVVSLVSSKSFVDYTDSHSAGTKMPRTNWKDMSRYPLALPPLPLAKAFQNHVADFHRRIMLNVRQNRRLAGLRDTLLPKLMSGEIDIPDSVIAKEVL
jgi:type I restriction enzyme S subunit